MGTEPEVVAGAEGGVAGLAMEVDGQREGVLVGVGGADDQSDAVAADRSTPCNVRRGDGSGTTITGSGNRAAPDGVDQAGVVDELPANLRVATR
jgi:hypothetical protein